MGFEALLGNETLKQNLTAAGRKGKLSHFYLISGPEGSGRHTLADLIAAAMLCREPEGPCGVCRSCRKVLSHTHPDYITIDDPEKKILPVRLIREARSDIFIRPNEGDKKIYLFPRGQDLNIEGQNALLKVLEEPPEYGVFLILADNPDKLLPTVRSRCVELKMRSLSEALLRSILTREFPEADSQTVSAAILRSGGYLGQARKLMSGAAVSDTTRTFARCYAARDVYGLLSLLVPMEKWKRDALIPELGAWLEVLEQAIVCRAGLPAALPEAARIAESRHPRDLMAHCQVLKKAMEYAQGNVSCAAVCGWLNWALR
ncbi:MAG: DNA polymerase III subunit [Oscillospiraceae bacterium]|nr:DNA polymerase III subunit [Oscillospiraceae bacterium]